MYRTLSYMIVVQINSVQLNTHRYLNILKYIHLRLSESISENILNTIKTENFRGHALNSLNGALHQSVLSYEHLAHIKYASDTPG